MEMPARVRQAPECLLRTVFPFICKTGRRRGEPKDKELCFVLFLDSSAVRASLFTLSKYQCLLTKNNYSSNKEYCLQSEGLFLPVLMTQKSTFYYSTTNVCGAT